MDINDVRFKLSLTVDQTNQLFGLLAMLANTPIIPLLEEIKSQLDAQLVPPEDIQSDKPETDFPL
jgi:hypothetical protein